MKYLITILAITLLSCTTAPKVPKNEFITVDYMNCSPIVKMFSEKQLSKLDETEKFLVKNGVECGVTYINIRIRKKRVRAYYPQFSIIMGRNKEDKNDANGPLHVTKINVEHCRASIAGEADEANGRTWEDLNILCSDLDKLLEKK